MLDSGGAGRGAWQGGVLHELMQWAREHGVYPAVSMGASAGGYAAADVATGTERTVMKGWTAWGDKDMPRRYPLAMSIAREWPRSRFRQHLHASVRYVMGEATIDTGLLQYCQAHHMTVIAYSPLGREYGRISDCDPSGVIDELARVTGKSPAQIVINWCLCKEQVIAIPKGNSTQHILDSCGGSDWRLSQEQLALLDSRIQYRRRSRFDRLVRQWVPEPLQTMAARALNTLPPGLRRRFC